MMVNGLPASRPSRFDVVQPIIKIENLGPLAACHSLDHFIKPGVRLHYMVFERKDVAIEVSEERELLSDVSDRQVIGIGEDVSWHVVRPQSRVKLDHRVDLLKDVAEDMAKLV